MMHIDLKEYLDKVTTKSLLEALELTFTKAFPDILGQWENEDEQAKLFISFSYLLESRMNPNSDKNINDFAFYHHYPDFCNHLFDMIDSYPENDKNIAYEILEIEVRNTITSLIIEGLQNGTISPDQLNAETEEAKKDDYHSKYLDLLYAFNKMDKYDKEEEIIKNLSELLEILTFYNTSYNENNEVLPVLDEETNSFDALDIIFSYIISIKEEVAKLVDEM